MIWLTWRQHRLSAVAVLAPVLAVAVLLAITGPQLADLWATAGEQFFQRMQLERAETTLFELGTAIGYLLPVVIGIFWGAPLVARELEAGTHRLVWTQSVTRTRWLSTKLAVIAAAAVLAGLFALALTWWAGPVDDAIAAGYTDSSALGVPRLRPELFGARGIVPVAVALFALAVGVAAGMLVRRTVAAMALTLVAVVAVQIALPAFVQPHLVAASTAMVTISEENLDGLMVSGEPGEGPGELSTVQVDLDEPGAWALSQVTVDADGAVVTDFPEAIDRCFEQGPQAFGACFDQMAEAGLRQRVEYVPASAFWTLQWRESALMLLAAAGLVGFCFWRVRRDF